MRDPQDRHGLRQERYFAISPLMLFPGRAGDFDVFLLRGGEFVLHARACERFTQSHRTMLSENGVTEVYVPCHQEPAYRAYVEHNLGRTLLREDAPLEERARLVHECAVDIVRSAFEHRLPETLARQQNIARVMEFVREALAFLCAGQSFETLARLVSHDYRTFSHCVHVFLYSSAILQTYEPDRQTLLDAGIGAMLHDIGKVLIPHDILNKTGALTLSERAVINTHPGKGVDLCAGLPLARTTRDCILLHHEKLDGSGYPGAVRAGAIPLAVRAVTIADIYDAMTTNRPYSRAMHPFQVLRIMRDEMFDELDIEMYKRFVTILSGARIV
jgi:HD-GYP domain-containing protein (c-di-GMP phosphodiesterase class II)